MKKLESLLDQVNLIQRKYADLAEYTGENYNVFNVLDVTSGYYGLICASDFGGSVPVISVQTVPNFTV